MPSLPTSTPCLSPRTTRSQKRFSSWSTSTPWRPRSWSRLHPSQSMTGSLVGPHRQTRPRSSELKSMRATTCGTTPPVSLTPLALPSPPRPRLMCSDGCIPTGMSRTCHLSLMVSWSSTGKTRSAFCCDSVAKTNHAGMCLVGARQCSSS